MCPDDYQSVVFCKFCQKSFMTENEFNQHNVLEHSNIVEFQDQLPVNEKILQLQKIPQAVSLCALQDQFPPGEGLGQARPQPTSGRPTGERPSVLLPAVP